MIGYRLPPPAEEEMTEAALDYEQAHDQLGGDFLDDIQHAIDLSENIPSLAPKSRMDSGALWFGAFRSA